MTVNFAAERNYRKKTSKTTPSPTHPPTHPPPHTQNRILLYMTESFKLQTVAGQVSLLCVISILKKHTHTKTQDIYSRRESDIALSSHWFGWGLRWGIVYLKKFTLHINWLEAIAILLSIDIYYIVPSPLSLLAS